MQRVRYELDPQNRLIVRKGKGPARYRQVLEGEFKIGPRNSLLYEAKTSGKIKFTGSWFLTDNHDLKLTLDRSELNPPSGALSQFYKDELILKGEIVSASAEAEAEASSLLFAVTTKSDNNKTTRRILTLKGAWQADKDNRLIFKVEKESLSPDSLTFEGGWEVNKSNEIVYRYTKTYLRRRKEKIEREIIFRGHWKFMDNHKLIYALESKDNSAFEFKLGAGSRIGAREDAVTFEIGAVLKQRLTLYGKWKIKKPLEVSFEINYGRGIRTELTLSKKLFKNQMEPYLKLSRSKEESGAQLGVAFRW